MLNIALLKEPMNWAIVTLMVVIGALAVRYLFASAAAGPAKSA